MTTPIIRKVSNVGGYNNLDNTDSPTTTTNSPTPIRTSRVIRVLSSSKPANTNNTNNTNTPNENNNNASTSTVDQQQQTQPTTNTTTTTTAGSDNNVAPDVATKKKVIVRVVKRSTVGGGGEAAAATTATTTSNNSVPTNNTPSNDNNNTVANNNNTSATNSITSTTAINNNNTNTTSTSNNLQSSDIKNNTTEVSTTQSSTKENNDEVSTNNNTTNPITPRTTKIADRWLQRTQTNAPSTVTTTTSTTTATAIPEPTTPKRRVRSITNKEPATATTDSTTTTANANTTSTNSTTTPVVNGTTENKNINSTNPQFGTRLASAAKSNSTIAPSTVSVVSPHQPSKSLNDVPKQSIVKENISKLDDLKLLTPEQLMMNKKADKVSDNIRPLRPSEIATWYGGSVSVATEDPIFDNSSIDDLKKEAPDIYYSNFLFNPLFDEQSACDTPIITMSAQEVLQYNFVVELMRKKYSNLLALDPIAFEEEMKNASSLSSLTLKNISSGLTHTDSVTSTEDVLSREDIVYPINKCSKNWKYQLKKKRENTKSNFNQTEIFTPRASVQLQSSSPSSPATSNSAAVNPLFDHLYYMPCWKHQIQLDQIVKRSGEQRKVQ